MLSNVCFRHQGFQFLGLISRFAYELGVDLVAGGSEAEVLFCVRHCILRNEASIDEGCHCVRNRGPVSVNEIVHHGLLGLAQRPEDCQHAETKGGDEPHHGISSELTAGKRKLRSYDALCIHISIC